MSKHTPGPWKVGSDLRISATPDGVRVIAEVLTKESGVADINEIANARLIAAAPELYAALSACRGQWIHSVSAKVCLAALAKAEGK
jgi:hypothetical protein